MGLLFSCIAQRTAAIHKNRIPYEQSLLKAWIMRDGRLTSSTKMDRRIQVHMIRKVSGPTYKPNTTLIRGPWTLGISLGREGQEHWGEVCIGRAAHKKENRWSGYLLYPLRGAMMPPVMPAVTDSLPQYVDREAQLEPTGLRELRQRLV
jgi:hypothetical protein